MGSVQLTDVTKHYGDLTAVQNMNLDIQDGEFVTFVGPSGCGKSTTLETIAGLTKPSSGTITISGEEVTNLPPKDRSLAMVFQNIALFPHMDVYDNMSFGLRLRDYDTDEINDRVSRTAEILQIEGMLDRMPEELSGGQRQRVAIGRAIVREPEVFLMDEPLANLDAKLRVHMRTELARLHKQLETTIIYVTHNQEEAMTMSDRIAVINEGHLQQIDPPLTCYNEPANRFVAGFIGSPSMNFLDGEITEEGLKTSHFTLQFDVGSTDVSVGDAVSLGVRPEAAYLSDQQENAESPSRAFSTTTDVLEPMGDEIFVYLHFGANDERSDHTQSEVAETGNNQLLMSIDPDSDIEEDQQVEVVLDRANLHLFDASTGDAIRHNLTPSTKSGIDTATDEAVSDD